MTTPGSVCRHRGLRLAGIGAEGLDQIGQAQIDNLGAALLRHHDVGGFQVAVNDTLA